MENEWGGARDRDRHALPVARAIATGRCALTTLPQNDLPKDSGILRTAARHNNAAVGVYAEVVSGGLVRRGDAVTVL